MTSTQLCKTFSEQISKNKNKPQNSCLPSSPIPRNEALFLLQLRLIFYTWLTFSAKRTHKYLISLASGFFFLYEKDLIFVEWSWRFFWIIFMLSFWKGALEFLEYSDVKVKYQLQIFSHLAIFLSHEYQKKLCKIRKKFNIEMSSGNIMYEWIITK